MARFTEQQYQALLSKWRPKSYEPPVPKKPPVPSYNRRMVTAFFGTFGIPKPTYEFRFSKVVGRQHRADIAWPDHKLLLEVQGGIFSEGRHVRGAALLDEYEKLNIACELGYRVIFVIPSKLMKTETAMTIRKSLKS